MNFFSFFILLLLGLYYIEPFEREFEAHQGHSHTIVQHAFFSDTEPEMKDALTSKITLPNLSLLFCLVLSSLIVSEFINILISIFYSALSRTLNSNFTSPPQVLRV